MLEDTLVAIKWLAMASFMLNLHKSQLMSKLQHRFSGIFGPWLAFGTPNVTKLTALIEKLDSELARFNQASLYGLLNFYREYVLAFAKLVKLLCQLLGQDTQPWMPAAGECIREVVWCIVTVLRWLNADLLAELCMETRVSSCGIAALLLKKYPDKPRTWTTMASLGHCLELLEKIESCILLELKALREGAWKMGKFTTFSQQLTMQVTLELHALLKVVPKAHLELQAMFVDVQQYRPTWVMGGTSTMPKDLDFPSSTVGKWEDKPDKLVDLDTIHCAESALGKVSLPPKARFVLGKVVHL